jgi:hypothetical protein
VSYLYLNMINEHFKNATDLLKAFPNETTCLEHLENLRWQGIIVSPFDPYSKVYTCKNNRYRCRNSGKYFNAKTDTIFQNSRIPLQKWFLAIWIVTNHPKLTSVELAQDLGLTQKTAWYILQRIKNYLATPLLPTTERKPEKKITKSASTQKIENIEVVQEHDKLAVTEWLQLLKK